MSIFGKILKATVKTACLPVAIASDIATLGVSKACDDKFFTEKLIDSIDEDMDK